MHYIDWRYIYPTQDLQYTIVYNLCSMYPRVVNTIIIIPSKHIVYTEYTHSIHVVM